MSYDISLVGKDALGEEYEYDEVGNYTYNCGPMFYRALTVGAGEGRPGGMSLRDMDGLKAGNLLITLEDALKYWDAHREEFIAMNPTNGWGDEASAREYLRRLYDSCRRFPDAIVSVT